MFEKSRKLLETYFFRAKQADELTDRATHTLLELRGRLRQLDFAYSHLKDISDRLLAQANDDNPTSTHILIYVEHGDPEASPARISNLPSQPQDELIVFLEYFYYSAQRCVDLIDDGRSFLPGLTRVRAKGVIDARNHLIEHTARKKGNPVFSFQTGPSGPRLRALRWSKFEESSKDPGLWDNAEEFRCKLNASLNAGIQHSDV